MERLKARNNFVLDNAINAYEHTADSALDRCTLDFLKELREYRDAEEQGLILRLPVAIGSTIYRFEYPTKIDDNGTEWSILDKKRATIKPMKFALCHLDSIGKLYFLTKEEAEQALAERKGCKDAEDKR